jgi:hypothetical protein
MTDFDFFERNVGFLKKDKAFFEKKSWIIFIRRRENFTNQDLLAHKVFRNFLEKPCF